MTIQQLLDGQDEDRERERRDGSIDLASFSLEKEALRDNLARFIESILGQAVAAIQAYSLDGPDNLFLLQASEVERDVPRIPGGIRDFHINPVPVCDGACEKTSLPLGSRHVHPIHFQRKDIPSLETAEQFLDMPAHRPERAEVIVPDEVGTPLPALDMGEQRSICGHTSAFLSIPVMKAASRRDA